MDIKILVATHKETVLPADELYIPVLVGKSLHEKSCCGYQPDNEGENISKKNPNYCELTALYWGWKNLKCDYIGLVHYRRYFCVKKNIKNKIDSVLSNEECKTLCSKYDVILPKRRNYYVSSLWNHYKDTHDEYHLKQTRIIIKYTCPEYLESFDMVMNRSWAHMFNMYIMKKEISDKYCEWLFPILFKLEEKLDLSSLSAFDARLFGRVSELLLDVWIEANNLSYSEVGMVQIGNANFGKKVYSFLMAKFFGKKYSKSR